MESLRLRKNTNSKKKSEVAKYVKVEGSVVDENDINEKKEEILSNREDKQTDNNRNEGKSNIISFKITFEVDLLSFLLFFSALFTRFYRLEEPKNIVFDELHYGKYVSLYMKNTFFFDSHPPLGKQLIAGVAYLSGYDGKFKFDKIGSPYSNSVPLFAMRLVPAFFGSLIIPTTYHLMLELGLNQWTSLLAGLLLLFDNAILTQSRFILMESMLLFFMLFGLLCILKFRKYKEKPYSLLWWLWLIIGASSLTCALCIKYVGFYSCCLGLAILARDYWKQLSLPRLSDMSLFIRFLAQSLVLILIPFAVYLSIFYLHLTLLYKAGPHDSIMTSAFQASLQGGLASITKGQPLLVAHGSQITLRHTHGRTCWLHSHTHVYPVRYPDKRGSSHQQQVTCYSFKDVNNWWIVKRPEKSDLVVEQPVDAIKHGDVVQLVHGITSRALNSHDVAAPMSPQCQEVSCYIDYNVSMPAQNLWRVDIINKDQNGDTWHTIQSLVRLIHVDTNQALKFSGRQLPDWGFHQHEVVADRIINQDDTIWNVEEHRYTKSEDQKERERDLITAEMIPTTMTKLSFWDKFFELQYKMMFSGTESVQNHMYSSEPLEWPFMSRGIAYWISNSSNAQIHLLGNIVIWYSATYSLFMYSILLVFYLLRRRRLCFDIEEETWNRYLLTGKVFLVGYLFHFLPYFFVERTLFLHNYLPAFTFKVLLMTSLIDHVYYILKYRLKSRLPSYIFLAFLFGWVCIIFLVFKTFLVLSYGMTALTTQDVIYLRWKDTWDFIIHKT
ncbi:hypothetical protein AMK59_2027 [Oryctes borbonicus]|uniref:Protein O-mannosyltransferase 1 n=1 Tax=Oryctes borbonicus TaxID=1629725 RepID=A0A0T6BBD0_9SCAR|nr:hypothetical protein AMK59_2027 [Oryctes borbonicus]